MYKTNIFCNAKSNSIRVGKYMSDSISINDAKKLYEVVSLFADLDKYYIAEIEKLKNVTIEKTNLYNTFSAHDIEQIELKKQILDKILKCFTNKAKDINMSGYNRNKVELNLIIPTLEEYERKLNISGNIIEYINYIVQDFARNTQEVYLQNLYTQKQLSQIFPMINVKKMSLLFVGAGVKRKTAITSDEMKKIINFLKENRSITEIARLINRPNTTIRNIVQDLKNEKFRNNKPSINNIEHNQLIKMLGYEIEGRTFYGKIIELYSEHVPYFSYGNEIIDLPNRNIDLIGIYDNKIIFVTEFENHNLKKSLSNLLEYKDVPVRVLFVNNNKLVKAITLRDQYTNQFDISVYKYYDGFEKDFVKDIRCAIKNFYG
jgi:hypothetical protein